MMRKPTRVTAFLNHLKTAIPIARENVQVSAPLEQRKELCAVEPGQQPPAGPSSGS